MRDTSKQIQKVNEHLSIALAELGTIAGSGHAYIQSLSDFKKLVHIKLKLDPIVARVAASAAKHAKPGAPTSNHAPAPNKQILDKKLLVLLGRQGLVDTWWESPNAAFNMKPPNSMCLKDVANYLTSYTSGD